MFVTHDPVHEWTTVLAQPRTKIHIMLVTYKVSHIDIDTSREKVVDLPHHAKQACL